MAKRNAIGSDYTNNADGWDMGGGTTVRKLTFTGGDSTITGGGAAVITFPSATDTLVGRASVDVLTNKIITFTAGTASVAPLKLTAGVNLTTSQAGTIEYDGTHLYFTAVNSGTRYQLDQQAGGSGVTSMSAAIGTVPNVSGGSISGTVLTLQPANGTFGGIVSDTIQSFAGGKTFNNVLLANAGFVVQSVSVPVTINGLLVTANANQDVLDLVRVSVGTGAAGEAISMRFSLIDDANGNIISGTIRSTLVNPATAAPTTSLDFYTVNTTLGLRMSIRPNGQIQGLGYGAGTFTGTVSKGLAVDSSGNFIETTANTQSIDPLATTNQALVGNTFNPFDATSGNLVATLPTAIGIAGQIITVRKTDTSANLITMASTLSQTINESAANTVILRKNGWSFDFESDGANWKIV